jgi:hypothetical protein
VAKYRKPGNTEESIEDLPEKHYHLTWLIRVVPVKTLENISMAEMNKDFVKFF